MQMSTRMLMLAAVRDACPLTYLSTYVLTYLFTYSLTHLLTHSLTHLLTDSLTNLHRPQRERGGHSYDLLM